MLHRAQTDEEIIAIGRKLSDLARAENLRDLERAGKKRPSRIAAAATALAEFRHQSSHGQGASRGLGSSKPDGRDSGDDSDWESASDSDSDSVSDDDSGLAYGSMPKFSDPHLPASTSVAGPPSRIPQQQQYSAAPSLVTERPPESIRPPDRKSSAVDPAMFGPVNSLRGFVNTPCGFRPGEYPRRSQTLPQPLPHHDHHHPHHHHDPSMIPQPSSSASIEASRQQQPLQNVYPVPTSDISRFDAAASSSVVSASAAPLPAPSTPTRRDRDRDRDRDSAAYSSRPDPVPIQAPKPRVPVSPRVLQEEQRVAAVAARERERERERAEQHHGSPRVRSSKKERERRSVVEASVAGAIPASVVGPAAAAAVAGTAVAGLAGGKRDDRREYEERRKFGRRSVAADPFVGSPSSQDTRAYDWRRDQRNERPYDHRDEKRDLEDRHSHHASDGRSVAGPIAAGVAAAAGAAALSHYKGQRELDELREKEAKIREERLRYEREAELHREARERREKEDRRIREEEEARRRREEDEARRHREEVEARRRREEEELRRIAEEGELRRLRDDDDLRDKYERRVREEREIRYKEERRTEEQRARAERDRLMRDTSAKRAREEKREIEGRSKNRDDDRSRDRQRGDRNLSMKDASTVVEVAKDAPPGTQPKQMDSLQPKPPKPSREERRAKREETRRMIEEIQKQIEMEQKRLAELDAAKEAAAKEHSDPGPSTSKGKEPAVDPFQFQVANDAFPTPQYSPPERSRTPHIETVERAPAWAQLEAEPNEEQRLSRRDSFENELRQAQAIVDETNHPTIPAEAGVVAAAVSVVQGRGARSRSRSCDPRGRGRDREPVRDPVQEEANRYYREKKMADKIAEDEARSRSASPSPSVVDKYEETEDPIIRIVTPPEMKEPPKKSKYDGPDADVRIDNFIKPHELHRFLAPKDTSSGLGPAMVPVFKSRDPSCERERPMLNLVAPTPSTSPSLEKMKARHASAMAAADEGHSDEEERKPKVILTARGEEIEVPEDYNTGRAVETDSGDSSQEKPVVKFKFGGKKKNTWTMIAAALAGASAVAAKNKEQKQTEAVKVAEIEGTGAPEAEKDKARDAEPVTEPSREVVSQQDATPMPAGEPAPVPESEPVHADSQVRSSPPPRAIPFDDLEEAPPKVGPKPSSPRQAQMPGAFADDLDFTATLAAGLESSGFDPNIVIEDPSYRRRDSPPGSNEPYYLPPSAETVTDLDFDHSQRAVLAEPRDGSILERVAPGNEHESSPTSSRKGRRKRQSVDVAEATEDFAQSKPEGPVDAAEETWGDSPSRKGKGKKSEEASPVWLDAPQSVSTREGNDDEWSTKKSTRESKRDSGSYDVTTYPNPPSEVSVASSSSKTSKKNWRKSTKDSYDIPEQDEPPDRPGYSPGHSFELIDREVSSVVSDPIGKPNGGRTEEGDDTKPVVSLPAGKRRSTNGTVEHQERSIAENGDKKDSFLGNAGTFGAGAGLVGAVAAIATQLSRPNATQDSTMEEFSRLERSASYSSDIVDPEVLEREIKPAIDPQYGDLLPLPPSEPGSPSFDLEENFPELPDSGPDTPSPPQTRTRRSTLTHARRRSAFETPKTPSRTAVPVQFLIGRGSAPSSPAFRLSPMQSPVTPTIETSPKQRARPTSWDNSREIKPLYLLEKASSSAQNAAVEPEYPELPPSEPPSRESPAPEFEAREVNVGHLSQGFGAGLQALQGLQDLQINTGPAGELRFGEPLGSGETTPRAFVAPPFVVEGPPSVIGAEDERLEQWQLLEDWESLPPLPESLASSPTRAPSSPVILAESRPFAREFLVGNLEDLPPLPDSHPETPVHEVLPLVPAELPSDEKLELPALPEGTPSFRDLDLLPPLPESAPLSPALPASPSSAFPQLPVHEDFKDLPPLPESRPVSPVLPPSSLQLSLGDVPEQLPPLPESRPVSPILASSPFVFDSRPPIEVFEHLPPLPASLPVSPALPPLPLVSTLLPVDIESESLPALPMSPLGSPISELLPRAFEQPHIERLAPLPGLPESRPSSPVEDIFHTPVSEGFSDSVLPAGHNVEPLAYTRFDDLPPLPESHPSSPTHEEVAPAQTTRALSPPAPPAEYAAVQERGLIPDLDSLPPLPESRSTSPTLEAVLAPVDSSTDTTPIVLERDLAQDIAALPPLPDSRPDSPTQLEVTPAVTVEPFSDENAASKVDVDGIIPKQESFCEEGLDNLPSLPESRPGSPYQEDPLPAQTHEDIPASSSSELSGEATARAPESSSDQELRRLPPLPPSPPDSPTWLPPASLVTLKRVSTFPLPTRSDSSRTSSPTFKPASFSQKRDFFENLAKERSDKPLQSPSLYEDLKSPEFRKWTPSPPPSRALTKQEAMDVADKLESTKLASAAAAGAAATTGILVAHMSRDGPQHDIQRLEYEALNPPPYGKTESVLSFNEDASTIAPSEAPTYMSGSTFYETQQDSGKLDESPPRSDPLGLFFGNRGQKEQIQEVDWAAAGPSSPYKQGKKSRVEEQQEEEAPIPQTSVSTSQKKGSKKKGKKEVSWIEPDPEAQRQQTEPVESSLKTPPPVSTAEREMLMDDQREAATSEQPTSSSVGSRE